MRTVLALLAVLVSLPAVAAEPFARASLEEGGQLVPGQQLHLTVDVFAPGFFTSPPQLPLFDIPDALVTLPEERASNLTQTIDGIEFTGIRRQYAIVPERAGSFAVPPIVIEFSYSSGGAAAKASVSTGATNFEVTGLGDGSMPFSAHQLEIAQSFDRDPKSLHVGDALVRTITITARETQAMLMPPVQAGTAPGLAQYAKPPKLEDGISAARGDMLSRRTDTVVYTVSQAGSFVLPAIRYPWFDIDAAAATAAMLPATSVEAAAAAARNGIAPQQPISRSNTFESRRKLSLAILLALAAIAAAWSARRLPAAALRHLRAAIGRLRNARRFRLHRLRKTILTAALPEVYAALQAWAMSEGFRTLDAWGDTRGSIAKDVIRDLEASLFAATGEQSFDRKVAATVLTQASTPLRAPPASPLPPLNPAHGA